MKSRAKYLIKNTSVFAVGMLGTKIINFFLVPFYTHVLTQEEYGTVDLIFTISMLITPLIMFNLGEALMRFCMDKNADYNKLFTIASFVILFGIIISLLLLPITSKIQLISEYRNYIYLYIVFCAIREVLTGFLKGKEQLKLYVSCNLINTFLIAVLNIVFLVYFKLGIIGYLTSYIIAEIAASLIAFIGGKMYKYIGKIKIDFTLFKKMIVFSLAVVPNSMLWWAINSSDRIMVTAISGVEENGILAVSYKLPSILTMISMVLMQAWKYSAIKENDSEDRDEYTNNMLDKYLSGIVLVSGLLMIIIKPLTRILFEKSYFISWQSSIFLLLGFVFMGISTFVGTIYYVKKNMVGNMLSALIGAIVNIVFNFILIPYMGASGATLAACVSYLSILLYRYIDTKKYQKLNLFNVKNVIQIVLLLIMIFGNYISGILGYLIIIFSFIFIMFFNKTYIKNIANHILKKIKR